MKTFTENDIRAYMTCPKLYSFGACILESDYISVLRMAYSKILAASIRQNSFDIDLPYTKYIDKSIKELGIDLPSGKMLRLHNDVLKGLRELFTQFPIDRYIPLTGAFSWRTELNKKYQLDLSIHGILMSNKTQLHMVHISDHKTMHDIRNDVIALYKAMTLVELGKMFPHTSCKLHLIYADSRLVLKNATIVGRKVSTDVVKQLDKIADAISLGIDFPILPCTRACVYKEQCFFIGKK